jgi:hypothetical protein
MFLYTSFGPRHFAGMRSAPAHSYFADTSEISANMSGDVILEFPREDGSPTVILLITGCLYVEDHGYTLISVGKLADEGILSIFLGGDNGT